MKLFFIFNNIKLPFTLTKYFVFNCFPTIFKQKKQSNENKYSNHEHKVISRTLQQNVERKRILVLS